MSNFKVGDKVLCVKTHSQGVVVKGREYIVLGVAKCIHCGYTRLDVGIASISYFSVCGGCRVLYRNNQPIWWVGSRLFVKADEQDNFASEVLEEIAEKIEVEFIELHNTEGNGL